MDIKTALKDLLRHYRENLGFGDDMLSQASLLEKIFYDEILNTEDQAWLTMIQQKLDLHNKEKMTEAKVAIVQLFREIGEYDINFDL